MPSYKPSTPDSFGAYIRDLRERRDLSLRHFARLVGISATYLSKVERDELPPPGEAKVLRIAGLLMQDPDELLARAGRIASDLPPIIRQRPALLAALLRATRDLSTNELSNLQHQLAHRTTSTGVPA